MKKGILILILLILALFSVSCIYAADVNDSLVASEDIGEIELSHENEMDSIDNNLKTSEEQIVTQTDNEEKIGQTDDGTFDALNAKISGASSGDTVYLENNYSCEDSWDQVGGISISTSNLVIDGNGHTIDAKGKARVFYVTASDVTIKNLIIKNANCNADGGAVYFSQSGRVINCNFTNNTASSNGGAVYIRGGGTVENSNFTNNHVIDYYSWGGALYFNQKSTVINCNFADNQGAIGGAVYIKDNDGNVTNCNFVNNTAISGGAIHMASGTVSNCDFIVNNADRGSAIGFHYMYFSATKTVSNSTFLNNKANVDVLKVTQNENNITITFIGQNNLINAINSEEDVSFTNVTYWGANGKTNTGSSTIKPSRSNKEAGQNITIAVVVNDKLVFDDVKVTDENGTIVLDVKVDGSYYIIVRHDEDSYYTQAETISSNMKFYVNVTETKTTNKTVNITAESNIIKNEVISGKLLFILPDGTEINATYEANGTWWVEHTFDDYGDYQINASYIGLDNVTINNATISISKTKTQITASSVTTTYNINKDLVITLTDANGNALSGFKVTVDLNGAKTYVTDANGQVKVKTKGLTPKTYTAKITFNGDADHDKSTKDVKVTVKKAAPKLIAKAKTFKTSVKTKKYTITLKDNTGKAIKKAKVTLKVKGKTYKATTNSKGKAVFKIKNLKKKGKYTAVIKFKGNKYYNKATKKAKIKVIVTFKTVSKGSKDKATVREIQQALKNNGYYLTYDGHYLKIDGIYHGCTERSVKEFQHDKGLKVTGKVDEKTVKKLGII